MQLLLSVSLPYYVDQIKDRTRLTSKVFFWLRFCFLLMSLHRHLNFGASDWNGYLLEFLFLIHHWDDQLMDCYLKYLICYYIKFVTDCSNSSSFHFAFVFTTVDFQLVGYCLRPCIFLSNHFAFFQLIYVCFINQPYNSFLFFNLVGCSFLTNCILQHEVVFLVSFIREQVINFSCFYCWPWCSGVVDRFLTLYLHLAWLKRNYEFLAAIMWVLIDFL